MHPKGLNNNLLSQLNLTNFFAQDAGATIYFSLPPFKDWQYIGSITVHMPSQIFHSPWRGVIPPNTPGLQIGISIEPKKFIENLHPQSQYEEEKKLISSVQGIAQDVYKVILQNQKMIRDKE